MIKEVTPVIALDILKGIAAVLSIVLSLRKLYRWTRRKPNKRKTTS
jgi:glycerol-3-phosphate acyltransferase PlsY